MSAKIATFQRPPAPDEAVTQFREKLADYPGGDVEDTLLADFRYLVQACERYVKASTDHEQRDARLDMHIAADHCKRPAWRILKAARDVVRARRARAEREQYRQWRRGQLSNLGQLAQRDGGTP